MNKIITRQRLSVFSFWFVVIGLLLSCGNSSEAGGESHITSKESSDTAVDAKGEDVSSGIADTSRNSIKKEDWLLIPGVSAGQTKIGENIDSIYQRLGRPDGGDAAMQKAVAIWYSRHNSTAHSIGIYTKRNTDSPAIARVLQIRITSPLFITRNGIHTSSMLSDIQSKFTVTKTETYEDAGARYSIYDSSEGIAFEVNRESKCIAIIIHRVGATGEGSYLKFRTTNQFIDNRN